MITYRQIVGELSNYALGLTVREQEKAAGTEAAPSSGGAAS